MNYLDITRLFCYTNFRFDTLLIHTQLGLSKFNLIYCFNSVHWHSTYSCNEIGELPYVAN